MICPLGDSRHFVLITKALRDEGTSHHYVPTAEWSHLAPTLQERLLPAIRNLSEPVLAGASWTTDAPYRETPSAIAAAEASGINCVEMEAAALYAYGAARQRDVVCFAHITNSMAVNGNDLAASREQRMERSAPSKSLKLQVAPSSPPELRIWNAIACPC